ncbi:MAG TPA: dihydropteroate synthase, partial [Candidatus Limnocylindria bacterium]
MTELRWGERTYVMGIINVTADSFSGDGLAPAGRDVDEVVKTALVQAGGFVEAGVDILDVGAESSRPAHSYGEHRPTSVQEEAELAVPTVAALAQAYGD